MDKHGDRVSIHMYGARMLASLSIILDLFRRIHLHGFFPTSMTQVNPNSRHGQVLHPTDNRIITLREYARSQGFPDSFSFYTDDAGDRVSESTPVRLHSQLTFHALLIFYSSTGKSVRRYV